MCVSVRKDGRVCVMSVVEDSRVCVHVCVRIGVLVMAR